MLLPHARTVLDLTSGGMWQIARYLGFSGSYPAARDLSQLIADAYTEDAAYGPEHPETLAARRDLAGWTGRAGDAAGARDQLAALLPVHERVLGPEHPDTLVVRHELAVWTGEAGDAAGARDQYAALLPVRERVLAPGTRTPWPPVTTSPAGPGGGGCGRGPRPVRRPAARPRAGPGPRAPRHPKDPQQPRTLDRGGGRCRRP